MIIIDSFNRKFDCPCSGNMDWLKQLYTAIWLHAGAAAKCHFVAQTYSYHGRNLGVAVY